jgi:aryl-alcohol dehydrogenase-like predicted oxidoreductase
MKSGYFDVILTAFNYSLLWREAEHAVLPTAREVGMGVVIGSPLQQGALSNRYDDRLDTASWLSPPRRGQYKALYAYLDEIGMPLTEAAMRFIISNEQIATVLTGARSIAEVDANISATEKGPLPAEVLNRVNEIAAMVPFRPFEEPFSLPFGRSYTGPGIAGR